MFNSKVPTDSEIRGILAPIFLVLEIILAQNDDGPLKWANDPYIPFKVMQISKFQWAF